MFLASLEGMLKLWEEPRLRKNQSHVMVTMKGRPKGETGENCHMMPLVVVIGLGIEIRKWVGRWMEILVEKKGRTKGCMFQHREGDWMNISDMEEGFQKGLTRVQLE